MLRPLASFVLLLVWSGSVGWQARAADNNDGLWEGYDGEWRHVCRQLTLLADATPAEKYAWRPAANVRSTGEVFRHIVESDYWLLSFTGAAMPSEIKNSAAGLSMASKEQLGPWLQRACNAVKTARSHTTPTQLNHHVKIADKDVTVDGIYLRILVHANEHMGQLIAYARMMGVKPPWSESAAK